MLLTEPEEFRVCRNLKRLNFQLVKGLIHNKSASTARLIAAILETEMLLFSTKR
jgi:hypothetical protein